MAILNVMNIIMTAYSFRHLHISFIRQTVNYVRKDSTVLLMQNARRHY